MILATNWYSQTCGVRVRSRRAPGIERLRENNIIVSPERWGLFLVDEGPDPSQRYKMVYFHQGLAVAFSADGLRFEPYSENPVIVSDEGTPYEPGYVNVIGDG